MIEINSQVSLKKLNTFGIDIKAAQYCKVNSIQQLIEALTYYSAQQLFILGGGSNMLLLNDIERPVVHINIKGITVKRTEHSNKVLVTAMAGENWHDFVMHCIDNQWAGIENMALIPGNVGTAPIQNIGAYGVELKDTFVKCKVIDINTQEEKTLSREDCKFGYRDSIFKNQAAGKYIITSVTLELTDLNQSHDYKFKTSYGAIQQELTQPPSLKHIAQTIIAIRRSKLPDPKEIGNSGSFFKNPIINRDQFESIVSIYPNIPHYTADHNQVKIPAGWLIDQCGYKGIRRGDAGVHHKQALVLVNYGNATGHDIIALATDIQSTVYQKFGINIETEVNLIDH